MNLRKDALEVLKETSRTFYIPISRLPSGLQEAVTSAYLCMRAIDEIEDHPSLDNAIKSDLLQKVSIVLQSGRDSFALNAFANALSTHDHVLPEVSLRIGEWAMMAPASIAPRVWDATAAMSDRMAYWANRNWQIHSEIDLDGYTFSVAGAVGLLLSDLWAWYDGTQTNRIQAIGYGRGLQTVNILRNRSEDLLRGADLVPDGWNKEDLIDYARRNLALGDIYTKALPRGPVLDFCQIPLTLAHATLEAIAHGADKLTRSNVMALIERVCS
ncbi:phytoene/squalene synthetase [Synechococcus sp. PCC 7502]|uniref:squalene/phytoene synthase family protein n=1 Tax=Synechococcus sp. PCC 7502 TaxID=1173263 RepID=UPI00029F9745|nr:phytoene/squalene synthase family protein [Synechococcus sp. PCC 7502]AFY73314.1 phytoene/squalene synthetase [Synechococcus sp. PCC 7502]